MEDYIVQCEKAMQTGNREDLPKYLQTKLNEQTRDGENEALKKAVSRTKMAETVAKPSISKAGPFTST